MAEQTTLWQEFEKWLTAQKNAMVGDGYINPFTAWEVAQYFHRLGERRAEIDRTMASSGKMAEDMSRD